MDKEVDVLVLDDGNDYYPIKELKINENTYLILADVDNPKKVCVRKQIINGNEEFITMLDSEEELDMVLEHYQNNMYTN